MSEKMYEVKIGDSVEKYPAGTVFGEIALAHQDEYAQQILLVTEDGRLRELHKQLKKNCRVEFVLADSQIGRSTIHRSLNLLLLKAFYDECGKDLRQIKLNFSISNAFYYTVKGKVELCEELLARVKSRMQKLVKKKVPI